MFRCRMIKNKRIKKNWSEEDVQILIWVISKYADKKGFEDIEKDLVFLFLFSMLRIGKLLPPSFLALPASLACLSGLVSRKSILPPTTGVKKNQTFLQNSSLKKAFKERLKTPKIGR